MSNGWVCDKCNRHFLLNSTEERHHIAMWPYGKRNEGGSEINLDLCETCKERLDKWIETTPYLGTDSQPYGWPIFEDGTPIKEGDEVLDEYGHGFVAHIFSHYGKYWIVSSGHGYSARSDTWVFKRPTKDQMAIYYKKYQDEQKEKKQQPKYVAYDGAKWKSIGYVAASGVDYCRDDVNHPEHYDNGSIECIDWIEERLSPEQFRGYLLGNALKYSFRYESKGKPAEDLQKAQWYLKKLEELA